MAAKAESNRPIIAGGRTLSKMHRGSKPNGSVPAKGRRKTWRFLRGVKYAIHDKGPSGHRVEK